MNITKIGRVSGPPAPNIHLGAAGPTMVSVCLTAPDKSGTLGEQTREILEIIDGYLHSADSSRQQMLMAQVWLAHIDEFPAFRDVWNKWIDPEHVPALSVVEAAASRRDSLVEIRVYAAR
ncbi:Rid family hydrolase [Phytoactinopolyspora limicola]|uniref:Rid family hydrolase n=1 Tax=Phytoactinopolyspora limicola TaxID=2715536 RepID=UPI001A9C4686|nr:Rid family hydrolase [Phytoactinopolyspora limicola]